MSTVLDPDPNSAILISGTPRVTGLDGVFFPCDPTATGFNRTWRSKGTGRIYYDQGWKIADVLTTLIYFAEDPEHPTEDSESWCTDPWQVDQNNWRPCREEYGQFRPVLTPTDDETETTTRTEETTPYYELTVDTKFQAVGTYFIKVGDVYYHVPLITAGNKVDPNTYYVIDELGNYVFTTDPYFLAANTYFTKVDDGVYVQARFITSEIPLNTVYELAGEEKTITITTVNNRTGETRVSKSTDRTQTRTVLDQHKRYYIPGIEVGHIYRFAFVKDFRYLGYLDPSSEDWVDENSGENDSDITRGVFKVNNILTYYKLICSGVDVYQNLYLPLKISRSVYELDRKTWMNDDVWYELVDPSMEARVFYVPLGIIQGIPDANVHGYDRYQLIIDIGVFQDPEFLTEVITDLNLLMKARFGIPTTAKLASYDKVYIPDEYYEWLEKVRQENIEQFMAEHGQQFYQTLFQDKYNKLYHENLALRQQNSAYEQIIAGGQA